VSAARRTRSRAQGGARKAKELVNERLVLEGDVQLFVESARTHPLP
jgi:hypothetical protein